MGKYIEKYYEIKANKIIYGATDVSMNRFIDTKKKRGLLYVGRLEEDTGLPSILAELKKLKGEHTSTLVHWCVEFVGDGEMREECQKHGKVYGFVDPAPFLRKAKVVYAGGYLTALEAMANKCEVRVMWGNRLKKDYWRLAPFYKFIKNKDIKSGYEWVKGQTWKKVAQEYLDLWGK